MIVQDYIAGTPFVDLGPLAQRALRAVLFGGPRRDGFFREAGRITPVDTSEYNFIVTRRGRPMWIDPVTPNPWEVLSPSN